MHQNYVALVDSAGRGSHFAPSFESPPDLIGRSGGIELSFTRLHSSRGTEPLQIGDDAAFRV